MLTEFFKNLIPDNLILIPKRKDIPICAVFFSNKIIKLKDKLVFFLNHLYFR